AFAGGALFVVSAAKQPLLARLIYFPVSVIAGYQLAPEILLWLPIKSSGVAAFASAACAITVTLGLIEKSKSFDFSFLRRGGPPSA
ncbi:putative holin, partial [Xanthomonas vasicola]